jgi:RNA polymerase sigma-70 factor (ECF subfamily)
VPLLTERAFGELYQHAVRPLWTYVYRVTGNAADADDIVQEAFCRVLCADISALLPEEQRRYVFRVASRLVVDRWRREKRERSWLMRDEREPAVAPLAAADDVVRIFERLKPRERALLWLAYVEQDSHQEIATTLGLKRGSVKVLLARARMRLRNLLTTRETRT